jgi:hypothetical protein
MDNIAAPVVDKLADLSDQSPLIRTTHLQDAVHGCLP